MATLATLPVETLNSIFSYTNKQTRKNLRLTCCLFADIGKQWVFHKVRLRPTVKSYKIFQEFMENSDLSQLVTKIELDVRYWKSWSSLKTNELYATDRNPDSDDSDYEYHSLPKEEDQELPEQFLKIFDSLLKSPKLRSIVLRFHHEVYGPGKDYSYLADPRQPYQFRLNAMNQMISSIVSAPRLPRELAIQDLQDFNLTDPALVEMITKILEGLQSFRLNITNEHDEGNGEHDLMQEEPHKFYPELPSFWLKPTMSNLRHLTLYSSLYFGFYPKCDLRGIHFPHLKTLSLGNYTFIHDSQLDWILSHGATLTELYLDDCPILFEVAIGDYQRTYLDPKVFEPKEEFGGDYHTVYRTRWCDYFRAFKDGLPHLRHFRYGHSPHWWDDNTSPFDCETTVDIDLHDDSYMVFCDGFGPSPYMLSMIYTSFGHKNRKPLLPSEEDKTALRELLVKTGQVPKGTELVLDL